MKECPACGLWKFPEFFQRRGTTFKKTCRDCVNAKQNAVNKLKREEKKSGKRNDFNEVNP